MADRVAALLQQAAEVQRLCNELLAFPEPLNSKQRKYIEIFVVNAVNFSSEVNEIAHLIERGDSFHIGSGFSTPITWWTLFSEFLSNGDFGSISDAQRNYLRQIEACGIKADALLKTLWDNGASQTESEEQ